MTRLQIDIPDHLADELERRAAEAELTVAEYVTHLLATDDPREWPEDFFDKVAGGWTGKQLRRPVQGKFEQRDDW